MIMRMMKTLEENEDFEYNCRYLVEAFHSLFGGISLTRDFTITDIEMNEISRHIRGMKDSFDDEVINWFNTGHTKLKLIFSILNFLDEMTNGDDITD